MFSARICAVSCLCLFGWSGSVVRGAEVTDGENAAIRVPPEFKISPTSHATMLVEKPGEPPVPAPAPRSGFFKIFETEVPFPDKGMRARTPGPDGRLYFFCSNGGASIARREGGVVHVPEEGAVLRCEADGSHLEVFCRGLRDLHGLAFDNAGNLLTGDAGSGSGDEGRWLYLVEHGDFGWRAGWPHSALGPVRNPWVAEKLWAARFDGQAAWILPPVMNVAAGPWVVAHYPGLGFSDRYDDHFFAANSALRTIFSLGMRPNGAGFLRIDQQKVVENAAVEGLHFESKAALRFWAVDNGGRMKSFDLTPATQVLDPQVDFAAQLLDEELENKAPVELQQFLKSPDQRVRLFAEWKLAVSPDGELLLSQTALSPHGGPEPSIARLHGIWGLGIMARRAEEKTPGAGVKMLEPLVPLLEDEDAEVRAQAARVLGESGVGAAFDGLIKALRSSEERTSMFAAEALGKLGRPEAFAQLVLMIREAGDHDPNLRHAYVDTLLGLHDDAIMQAARHDSPSVRMAAILAMRQLKRADLAQFLEDDEPSLVLEAARAIHDENVAEAMPQLAALIGKPAANEALMVRVLNANFRMGQPANASALATFAAREDAAEVLRIDALKLLALWPHPPANDYVTGATQSLPERDIAPARDALAGVLPRLQAVKSPEFTAAVMAARKALQGDGK